MNRDVRRLRAAIRRQSGEQSRGAQLRAAWRGLALALAGMMLQLGCWGEPPMRVGDDSNLDSGSGSYIRGIVRDETGPVAGAVVRVQTTDYTATTTADGKFVLGLSQVAEADASDPVPLTAWAPGYYIVGPVEARVGDTDATITLESHTTSDNAEYAWLEANLQDDESIHCQQCHSDPNDTGSMLPFDEWQADAHGTSATNPRFLSMYRGVDLSGRQSPPTRYFTHRDYGRVPLPPDPNQEYYGPGFKLDFPEQAGNCAACHLPAAATDAPYGTDPDLVTGVGTEGVTCDFCHKIWDVRLDPATGLPYDNMPGVLSIELLRPGNDRQLFIGPLDDVAPGDDTCSPLYQESLYCAPCHSANFWGVEIYNSYGEWLASSYSDAETGQTCQDCHMPRRGATRFVREDEGGLLRNPDSIASHLMPGAADESLLQNTAELTVGATRSGDAIEVEVSVTNTRAGHHIPTDSPLRNILLVVSASDSDGVGLDLTEGPVLPAWAGDYAGEPGRAYAKVLEELWTEVSPSGAYWNQTRILSDTRLPAEAEDVSQYTFSSGGDEVTISVQLLYRRAFYELMQQKGWDVPDIVMEETQAHLPQQ